MPGHLEQGVENAGVHGILVLWLGRGLASCLGAGTPGPCALLQVRQSYIYKYSRIHPITLGRYIGRVPWHVFPIPCLAHSLEASLSA